MSKEIESLFVPYEQSLQLKELGFDEPCLSYYDIKYNALSNNYFGKLVLGKDPDYLESTKKMLYILGQQKCLAPLYSQAFKWFKDKYNFTGTILGDGFNGEFKGYYYSITEKSWINYFESIDDGKWYNTYEEAELECLKKLILIVKSKL